VLKMDYKEADLKMDISQKSSIISNIYLLSAHFSQHMSDRCGGRMHVHAVDCQ
jgi:hypothetical protein